jgi:antitoxin HigA-1
MPLRSTKRTVKPTHPGEILREDFMPDYSLSVADLARSLGVSRQTVNELLRERRALSADLAVRLGRLFGNSPEFWLNAQKAVDLWEAERNVGDTVRPIERPRVDLDPGGLADLCKRHHILWLALFGSVLREDFSPDSDIDMLVTFLPGAKVSLFDLVEIGDELSELTGRRVDLVPAAGLKPLLRDRVLADARTVYDAA